MQKMWKIQKNQIKFLTACDAPVCKLSQNACNKKLWEIQIIFSQITLLIMYFLLKIVILVIFSIVEKYKVLKFGFLFRSEIDLYWIPNMKTSVGSIQVHYLLLSIGNDSLC